VSTYEDRTHAGDHYGETHRYGDDDISGSSDTTVLERERADEVVDAPRWRLGWNSGADLGLLLMRVVAGGVFAAHGAQKVFGWWSGPGLDGFASNLGDLGYKQTDIVSAATGFTELVGGVLLVLGLFTPLAAAGLVAVAVNAVWVKWGNGLFLPDGGFEAELALGALAAGLTLTGPGRAALDYGRVWFRHPVVTGWFFLLVGAGAGVLARLLFHGTLI
jgi:putative oxidoreductase